MVLQIEEDVNRFKKIIKGKIKENLRKYISHGEMIGKRGKEYVSIPIPQIDLPRFKYGNPNNGGVSSGDGEEGDPVGAGEGEGGAGKAGNLPGRHVREVELTLQELADIMGEQLELPRIEPRGQQELTVERYSFKGIRHTGPESLRHFKRTYREALKRQVSAKEYNPGNPIIIPIKEDKRYRSWTPIYKPQSNAVVLYMMDVSGSMGEEQKEIVRIETFWIDTWLRKHYPGLKTRYIIHDAAAAEVDRETFFSTRESGGTVISSAYELAANIIEQDYPVSEWNIYPFHFSDGDNWSLEDNARCFDILENRLFPISNMFCYGQVESAYGSGKFINDLKDQFPGNDILVTSQIADRDAIIDSIKDFLGKGR